MPRAFAEKDRFLETVYRVNKYSIGQVIIRYGKHFRITRIVENNNGEYDVYGIEV